MEYGFLWTFIRVHGYQALRVSWPRSPSVTSSRATSILCADEIYKIKRLRLLSGQYQLGLCISTFISNSMSSQEGRPSIWKLITRYFINNIKQYRPTLSARWRTIDCSHRPRVFWSTPAIDSTIQFRYLKAKGRKQRISIGKSNYIRRKLNRHISLSISQMIIEVLKKVRNIQNVRGKPLPWSFQVFG